MRFLPNATCGPKNRSSSHPPRILPSRLDPPSMDEHSAAFPAVRPRSVSSADRCGIAPFMLIELTKGIAVIIQKAKDRRPCCHVIPEWVTGLELCPIAPRSRMAVYHEAWTFP